MKVVSVQCGSAQAMLVEGRNVMTAYAKTVVPGPVPIGPMGLQGDEQADRSVHGGLAKAVYAYPREHLPFWQTVRAQARVSAWGDALAPGAFAENLSTEGLLENRLWIGDRLRLPGCELLVSAPRLPCAKFAAAMGFAQATRLMVQSGYCGFYLGVLQGGVVRAGDPIELLPGPREVSIAELFRAQARA